MTRILTFVSDSRLLVFAPHPDDETLATGELIQLAIASGADVRVVFATDGDNNPWPQRWVEKRWHLGTAERARWGNRRRSEAIAALAKLGVPAESVRFLGWPDLGLTEMLERGDVAINVLAGEIGTFAPTHVAMPSLRDRHPDHGALRVIAELAIGRTRSTCVRLGYVVHGRTAAGADWLLPRDSKRQQKKREALLAHTSQTSLSERRLLRWASEQESFEQSEPSAATNLGASDASVLRIPLAPTYRFMRQHELLVVLADGDRIESARLRLPRWIRANRRCILGSRLFAGRGTAELVGDTVQLSFDGALSSGINGYVKLERSAPRVMIFDVDTWQRFEDLPNRHAAAARIEPVAIAQRASL